MIALYTLGWMLLPFAFTYLVIWAMWWPRYEIPHGRIAAMTGVIYTWCMLYAAIGSNVFDWIQRLQL
jgi:uncharacterized membrane protein